MIEFTLDKNEGGQRLDRLLRKKFAQAPLSFVFKVIRQKKVRLNGKRAKAADRTEVGDLVQIYANLPETAAQEVQSEFSSAFIQKFQIIEETEDYLVLNKPAGVAVHPGSGQAEGETVIDFARFHCQWNGKGFSPALAHRLDKGTSGVILIAKSAPHLRTFTSALRHRQTFKEYIALVKGAPPEKKGTLDEKLERTDSRQGGSKVKVGQGQKAVTHYEVVQSFKDCSLVKINLGTGRMHQIRAHFNGIDCPLLGDDRYWDFGLNRQFRKDYGLKRMFLHAHRLRFKGFPEWQADLPPELEKVLQKLQNPKNA